jgi:hypothetical protein
MNRPLILSKLQQFTGKLKSAPGTSSDDLLELQRHLAEQLIQDSEFTVSGNRLHHEAAEEIEAVADPAEQFSHLSSLFEDSRRAERAATPTTRVFRRETAFHSNLLGTSVPEWGAGMAVTKSYGPFIDEHGLQVWFDFYQPVQLVSAYIAGNSSPALLIPVSGTITARQTYKIKRGSVWIASNLIAKTSQLDGYFTGLKVKGGSLELSSNSSVNDGKIYINPGVKASLHLDLEQNSVNETPGKAGADAREASIRLPETADLVFSSASSSFSAGDASCTTFGCEAEFRFFKTPALWIAPISQILVPYSVKANTRSSDTFQINSSDSSLCNFAGGGAKIGSNSGWLLPAAKINPSQLGAAAGTGALCIGLEKGINANWKGLQGKSTDLILPAIITEPGLITVVDFFAKNIYGKQRWLLWRNDPDRPHHSEITLGFGKAFPFIFISSTKNTEAVFFFCNHKASLDRPVDANAAPFKIESLIAFAGIVQTGKRFRVLLFDNDLLFDGNFSKPDAFKRHSIILRNALFNVTRPYSLFLQGDLEHDKYITEGALALMFGIYLYLPTLPDPYVANYTALLRGRAGQASGNIAMALAGFVKWNDRVGVQEGDAEAGEDFDNLAYVYFRFAPSEPFAIPAPSTGFSTDFQRAQEVEQTRAQRDFRTGVLTFNRDLAGDLTRDKPLVPMLAPEQSVQRNVLERSTADMSIHERVGQAANSGEIQSLISDLQENPMMGYLKDKTAQVDQTLNAALGQAERGFAGENPAAISLFSDTRTTAAAATVPSRGDIDIPLPRDMFMLLDVSSNADQMGVSLGTAFRVERDPRGETNIRNVNAFANVTPGGASAQQLQILNMDVVCTAQNLRAVTLPQISWEPVSNIPLAIEGAPDPQDLVTVAPGLLVYDNDGIPTYIFSESPYLVPITPLSVTKHFLQEFHDRHTPRQLRSFFTLPFALIAQADFNRKINNPANKNAQLSFNRPQFGDFRGGLQIKALAPAVSSPAKRPSFEGWTVQLDNIKWFLFGVPLPGSTLGRTVKTIFNGEFTPSGSKPQVPLEKMEISGYGASIFSNWLDGDAAIAEVSQAKFDVLVGRTAHEVIQVRSILYPFGVHVVRTITLMRSPSGYVFRSDSGWKAESDGFYNFNYKINFKTDPPTPIPVNDPYTFHKQPVKGVSNVREIRDYPDGGMFTSSFKANDPDLPPAVLGMSPAQWLLVNKQVTTPDHTFKVEMQAVVFDADVHLDNVVSGGEKDPEYGDFKVQSRKMLGYVQLSPPAILVPAHTFAELLKFQKGSLGGPVDCIINIAGSKQRMRLSRVDVNPAKDAANKDIFATAARGSLILPPDGSWSVVKQLTDTGDVKPVEEGQSVPLIKPNSSANYKIANPSDVVQEAASKTNFGVLQTTGTQKLLFDIPQFTPGQAKLKSSNTYFADAYKLLNSKGPFPNLVNATALTNAEKEVEILGEGLMKMAERNIDLGNLLPANYEYPFIYEKDIIKIYAQYKSTSNTSGKLKLGIDSAAALADKWKAALSNVRVVVDLGKDGGAFKELMWVDGNFNASSGLSAKYDLPKMQFGDVLKPIVEILEILAKLTGNDFDKGMDVGMSNSPDNWEYKFSCSKEIPVIKFPSPEQLTLNPNPPLKLEAGLRVGFYFNQVLAIPSDLKQLVPACGAFVEFHGGLQVMCFSLAAASIYAVGQVTLGIAADTKAGISLHMKFGFGVEIVVGLPVVGNASVLYMVEIIIGLSTAALDVGAMMLFRGSAEICGGLVGVCIQIEAGGTIHRDFVNKRTDCIAQVTFSIDITILWIIDIDFSDSWSETRQIS